MFSLGSHIKVTYIMLKIAQFILPFNSSPRVLKDFPNCHALSQHSLNTHQVTQKNSSLSYNDKIKPIIEKVKQVALFILKVGISALLYWVNPSLFAIGFIAGIILDDQVRVAIQKIKNVWSSQKIAGTLLGGFACTLSMPVTLATASLLWSAHLGSLMTPEAAPLATQ